MTWLQALPGLLWGVPFVGLARLRDQKPSLDDVTPVEGIPLSVIIPARNESSNIEQVVTSILASSYQPFELILVDDRSTDDTAARIARLAAADSRITVVDGEDLPEGWFGKPWACTQGAMVASGEILLFTDADTWHDPALLGRAVGALMESSADLLTLTSRQRCLTFWERVVMPQIMGTLAIRFAPPLVNRATRPDQVVANGQFIMMPQASYFALGGHTAVRGQVVEDLALAQRVIRMGQRLRVYYSGTLLTTRMYRSLDELIEGWSKNLYLGARESAPGGAVGKAVAPVGLLLLFLFWLLPFIAFFAGATSVAIPVAMGLSLAFWTVMTVAMEIPAWYALGYPLGAGMALWISARSIWRGAHTIEWRGREYDMAP